MVWGGSWDRVDGLFALWSSELCDGIVEEEKSILSGVKVSILFVFASVQLRDAQRACELTVLILPVKPSVQYDWRTSNEATTQWYCT